MAVDIESIGVGVDTSGVKQGTRDLDAFGRSADQASRKADNLGKAGTKGAKELGGVGKSADLSALAVARFGGAVGAAYTLLQTSHALIAAADQYTKLTAQIRNATRTQQEYNAAFSDVTRIAKTAQSEIESISKLYARLTLALRDANRSQQEVATITETVALALKVNGASVAEQTSAMLQLSQAFGSGVLRGEEFNAVMESAPNLMRRLADSMGVPIGQLRNLASEGRITITELTKAFNDSTYLNMLREQSKNIQTIGGAWQVFKNELILSIGQIDQAAGSSRFLSFVLGGAGLALKEATGRGGNSTAPRIDPEAELFKGLKRGVMFGGMSGIQIGDTPEIVKKQEAAFADLTKTLKLAGEETARLNNLEKQANEMLAAGTINSKQHALALAGIREERARLAKKSQEDTSWYADLQRQQDEMVFAEMEARDQRIAKIREEQTTAIENLQKQAMGWEQLSEAEKTAWEIQNGRFKDFDQQSKDELARLADLLDMRTRIADLEKDNLEAARRMEDDAVEESLRLYKKKADEQREVWESIEKTAHDTFVSIFDSGKSAFDRLKDTLKNGLLDLLYQMTLKKWIVNISAGVTGGTSGAAAAAGLMPGEWGSAMGGTGGFGLGSVKSIFDVVTKGFEGANNIFLGAINDFGASVANLGGVFSDVGGWIGQYSGTIASVAPFVPSIISILSGDLKGGIASGIGAGIGMAIGGPVGGAVGSALGSLVGGLFGGKDIPMVGSIASGQYSGGKFSGSFKKFGDKDLGAGSSLDALNKAFTSQLGGLLGEFGLNDAVSMTSRFRQRTNTRGQIWVDFEGGQLRGQITKNKDFQTFVDKVLGEQLVLAIQRSKLPDGIRALFSGMTDKTQVSNMIQAAANLNSSQAELAERFGLTVNQAAKVASATGAAGDSLIAMVNALAGAANVFKTVGEAIIEARDTLTEEFTERGGGNSLPSTLKAFDDILKGIDKTTQAGIKQFAELYAIRDSFNQYVQSLDSLKGGVKGALFGIVSPAEQQAMMQADLAQLFGSLNLQIPGSVQELINLGKSIDYTTEEGLNLAAAFPSLVQAFVQAREQVDGLVSSMQELDINRFRTLVDYTRAQHYVENGISLANLPSYDVGTSFVPNDGPAMIHAGERIFTRSENSEMVAAVQNLNGPEIVTELRKLREVTQRQGVALIMVNQKMHKILDRMDNEGVILSETDREGTRTTLDVLITNTGAAEAVPVDTTL